jgi:RHS repeat-associated protein
MARWTKALPLLSLLALAPAALAYHVPPWDTGHQSFSGDPGIPETDPGETRPCGCGSPVEVATGNFIHALPQFSISGLGPPIEFALIYNSHDLRRGTFGVGWTHPYEERLVLTTDGTGTFALYGRGEGKRDRFTKSADGHYTAPPHTFLTLSAHADAAYTIRDKHGLTRTFDADGKMTRITDRNGNALVLGYDSAGFLTTLTDASGRVVRFTKGPNGRVTSITDPANGVYQYSYDSAGHLTRVSDPLNQAWTFKYDTAGLLSEVGDPRGNAQITLDYGPNRRVGTLKEREESWVYTFVNGKTTKHDSRGNAWVFEYNDAGSITKATNPRDHSVSYSYDAQLNITSMTDENGNQTKYSYDSFGNLVATTDALGNTRLTTYEASFNFPASITDALGNVTLLQYDATGNLLTVTDPSGAVSRFQYDAKGQLTQATDAGGGVSTLAYDPYGNVVSRTAPGKSAEKATYDIRGDLLTSTDARGMQQQFTYDLAQRLITTTDPSGAVTTREYDSADNLTTLTLPNGAMFKFEYDTFSRLTKLTNPLNQSTSYSYDARDNVVGSTDALGRDIDYSYDELSRLVRKTTRDDSVRYSYDQAGNLVSIANDESTLNYTLDALNRIVQEQSTPQNAAVAYTFDAAGRLKTLNDGSGGTITYGYNRRSLVTSITDFDGFAVSYDYDSRGRRTRMDRTGGFSTAYSYDAANRLLSQMQTSPAGPLNFVYTYDQGDNRITMTDASGTHAYGYNRRDFLTSATHPTTNNPAEAYSYDTVGNRLTSHLSTTYTHDAANRETADARFDYTYDADGNLVQRRDRASANIRAYEYDTENRITKITFVDGTTAKYRYDGLGRRYEKNVDGVVTRFVYTGETILKEVSEAGQTVARYTPGVAWDEISAVRRNGETTVVETDGLGSVVRTVAAGKTTATFVYDSFGRIVAQTGTPAIPYAFHGREFDAESRLYYFRARYYDPQSGRFLVEDPVGLSVGFNLYSFVDNNPVKFVDPLGLAKLPAGPSGLGPEWVHDPTHRDPNGERYRNPNGDVLDWHPSQGGDRWKGTDHWHHRPKGKGGKKHLEPGEEIPESSNSCASADQGWQKYLDRDWWEAATGLTGVVLTTYVVVSVVSRLYPPRNLVPVP